MTELPAKVRVGPLYYQLSRDAHVTTRGRWGETDNNLRQFRFGTDTDPERMSVTVLHEFLHAVWHVYGNDELFTGKDPEETVMAAMAMGLAQVLMDIGMWPTEIKLAGEP